MFANTFHRTLSRALTEGFIADVLRPLIATAMSCLSGYIAWNSYETILAASLAFAATLFLIVAIFIIQAAHAIKQSLDSPRNKIVLNDYPALIVPAGEKYALLPRLSIRNLGAMPIQVDCSEFEWSLENKTGSEQVDKMKEGVVQPQSFQWLNGPEFPIPAPIEGVWESVTVRIKVKMKYGNPNNLKYSHVAEYYLNYMYNSLLESESSLTLIKFERYA